MQTLFIGFVDDSVDPSMKGIGIRIAYLLSAQLRIAGNISTYFVIEENLRSMSFEQKIKFIDEREKEQPNRTQFYQHYKNFQKLYKKDRGHNKELIVLQKKTEKSVNDMFNIYLDATLRSIKAAGLLDLKALDESLSYGEYYISYQYAENEGQDYSKLSDILQLNLDEDDNKTPTVFLLNYLFFSEEFKSGDTVMPALNTFSESGFVQELFTFPNYNDFSITDLNTIRFEVNKSLADFQQCINTFTTLNANPAEAFNYLQNDVAPIAKVLAENINNTGLVASYTNLKSSTTAADKLYLGMIPRYVVFKYFEFIKASQEETIAVLHQLPDNENHQLVPVLIVALNTEPAAVEEANDITNAAESMPLKKSLSID
jgi:hypothetical protein